MKVNGWTFETREDEDGMRLRWFKNGRIGRSILISTDQYHLLANHVGREQMALNAKAVLGSAYYREGHHLTKEHGAEGGKQ